VNPTTRHELADSLRRVVRQAESPRAATLSSAVPVVRPVVVPWAEALRGFAERLERAAPINPCGVARVLELLTDGRGPLYNAASRQSLETAIWWVADALCLCPPHTWDCPAIMKLDPDRVVWACASCGALAMTDDLAVRPA
jgi:hypothetical protein